MGIEDTTTSIMIIRCPQCQYANKVEAEAAKPRIVCSRCATVVSIEFLSNYDLPASRLSEAPLSQTPLDMNKQETSPLDLDSLLETDSDLPVTPPAIHQAFSTNLPVAEEFSDLVASPVVAVRSEEEEILDIPRSGQVASIDSTSLNARVEELLESGTDSISAAGESVTGFAGSAVGSVSDVTKAAYDKTTETLGNMGDKVQDSVGGVIGSLHPFGKDSEGVSSARENVNEFSTDAKDFVTGENHEAPAAAFGQDSYNFKNQKSSTFVMATPDSNNRGLLTKLMLGAAALCALLAIGWFALSGSIKELFFKSPDPVVNNAPVPAPVKPTIAPGTVPSLGAKVGASATAASPGVAPAGSAVPGASPAVAVTSSKPAPSVTAPTPAAATPKVASTPAPPNSGHAVGAGNGSLTIQIGAFKSESEANSRISKLKASGIDARVVKAEVPGKGVWYRVQAGRFTNESDATKYGSELKAKGSARDFIVTGYQGQ